MRVKGRSGNRNGKDRCNSNLFPVTRVWNERSGIASEHQAPSQAVERSKGRVYIGRDNDEAGRKYEHSRSVAALASWRGCCVTTSPAVVSFVLDSGLLSRTTDVYAGLPFLSAAGSHTGSSLIASRGRTAVKRLSGGSCFSAALVTLAAGGSDSFLDGSGRLLEPLAAARSAVRARDGAAATAMSSSWSDAGAWLTVMCLNGRVISWANASS